MGESSKQLVGSWTQAIGTVVAAIGSTPSLPIHENGRRGLGLIGNVLQATGNGLEADAETTLTYGKLGNIIQATGNIMVSAGLIIDFSGDTEERLVISGDLIQALGVITALGSADKSYIVIGNGLQALGNSLQAVGGARELKEEERTVIGLSQVSNEVLIALGSWTQALGTILLAIGLTLEEKN
ncbi:hypothetical protein FZC74_09035 [Sutcliffiella horikoshii]|uniref:AraC family transcriptional regulator n=1 Tax=Sutcliffiella horikoshii TaxID=79883 RepID=A0AA94WSC2_9BACI|nr:hypothetical protein [Sutcliffiella horikoshii]TYS60267.1 hypothetical protein FZC74_09035 [Sutcliffiella horikoshii]